MRRNQLDQLRNLFPTNDTVRGAFAISKALQGKPAEAISYFESATQQNPTSAQLWNNLGNAYLAAGEKNRAEDAYRRAGELSPH